MYWVMTILTRSKVDEGGKKSTLRRDKKVSREADWTTDLRMTMNMPLQSSALPTELSRDHTKLTLFWVFILLNNYSAWQMVIDYNFITTIASSYRPNWGDFILCSSTYNIIHMKTSVSRKLNILSIMFKIILFFL